MQGLLLLNKRTELSAKNLLVLGIMIYFLFPQFGWSVVVSRILGDSLGFSGIFGVSQVSWVSPVSWGFLGLLRDSRSFSGFMGILRVSQPSWKFSGILRVS